MQHRIATCMHAEFRTVVLLCFCISAHLLSVDAHSRSLRYDAARPITTLHGPSQQNSMQDLERVLDGLLVDGPGGVPVPLVVYVHGRGNEPRKSYDDTSFTQGFILRNLERQDVRVLGFNWPSKARFGRFCDRPVKQASASAGAFIALVQSLSADRNQRPLAWKGRPVVLLVHSMGSFVLAAALRDATVVPDISNLFTTVVVTSSDAPADGHAEWISKINGPAVYITSNPADRVLARSMKCEGPSAQKRLGLLPASDTVPERVESVSYVEFPLGEKHRYFVRGGLIPNSTACTFMRALLTGRTPEIDQAWRVGSDPLRVQLPVVADRGNACFDQGDLEEDVGNDD